MENVKIILNRNHCESSLETNKSCRVSSNVFICYKDKYNTCEKRSRRIVLSESKVVIQQFQSQQSILQSGVIIIMTIIAYQNCYLQNHAQRMICTKDDQNRKKDLGQVPEPFLEFSSLVSKRNCQEIQYYVGNERILKQRIEHGNNFSGWGVIPINKKSGPCCSSTSLGYIYWSFSLHTIGLMGAK